MDKNEVIKERLERLEVAAHALEEDRAFSNEWNTHPDPRPIAYRHQLALIRDDPDLREIVMLGIGMKRPDAAREKPDQRGWWYPQEPAAEHPEAAKSAVSNAHNAMEARLRSYRQLIRLGGDLGEGLQVPLDFARIRRNRSLRESVLAALEFHREEILVDGKRRVAWLPLETLTQ